MFSFRLTLSLLVLWIAADDHDFSVSADDFTFVADRFHRRSYFHDDRLLFFSSCNGTLCARVLDRMVRIGRLPYRRGECGCNASGFCPKRRPGLPLHWPVSP